MGALKAIERECNEYARLEGTVPLTDLRREPSLGPGLAMFRNLLIVRFRSPAKSAVTMSELHADPVSEIRVEKTLMGKQKSVRGALIDLQLTALD